MRIMLVLEAAGGGAGRHVLDLIAGLLRRGHSVTLAYSENRAEETFRSQLRKLGNVDIHCLQMRREIGISDFHHALALRSLIKRLGPFDILHAHSSKAGALLRLAQIADSTPSIYTPHALMTLNPDLGLIKRFIYGAVERFLSNYCASIICVSEHERNHALGLGISESRLIVVHNGIDTAHKNNLVDVRDKVRMELGIDEQTICIGTVGRLSEQKSVDRLITAFSMSEQQTNCESKLLIVGDGPERQSLEKYSRQVGVYERVIFTGHQDGVRMMSAMDVFALSSHYEALPYVLIEAAALGLPIVMTETGGAGSIVRNDINGFVVPQKSMEMFAAGLAELINRPERRSMFGNRSKQIAGEFNLDQMVDETIDVYSSCAESAFE